MPENPADAGENRRLLGEFRSNAAINRYEAVANHYETGDRYNIYGK